MLQHCLERLLAESVKFKDLRESVQEALETFAAQQKALQLAGDDPSKISADRYWNPFKIALNPSKPVKIRETALNLLQKLIAHNLLRGALPGNPIDSENDIVATSQPTFFGRRFSISHLFKPDDPPSAAAPQLQKQPASLSSPTHPTDVSVAESENANSDTPALETGTQYIESASTSFNHPVNSPTKSAAELASETSIGKQLLQNTFLMDEIISTVISSINNQQSNAAEEALQLQVLQVLLTAVTSTECEVHERSLLRVVQICFAIHANGQKNSVNEVTAKASLTQMVNLIFSRMERYADVLTKALESGAPLTKLPRTSSVIDLEPYAVSKMDTTFEQPQGSSEGLAITTTLAVSDESLPVIQTIKDENEFKSVETRSLDADTELTLESEAVSDLYVNYDCDMATSSVFEKIINICAKITQGRADLSSKSASHSSFAIVGFAVGLDSKAELIREQDQKLKIKGLCALVAAIQSLDTWCQEPLPQDMPIVQNHDISQLLPESTDQTGSDSANPDQAGSLEPLTMVGLNDKSGPIYAGPSSATKSLDGFSDTATAFMDALAPTNHARTVVVGNRNPLLSVTMDKTIRKEFVDGLISKPAETNQQDMEQVVSRKQLLRRAVRIFNQSPKKGIQALADIKFITLDPESISEFLLTTPELSKSAIGIYLGEGDPHNIKVMHAFVDALEFSGMAFVAALRFFLQHFRLPGEAQKIDRMMEKFADRYCESNPGVFANADAAYTLAFSVMMLNTDQHSSQIKNRMDKPAFIKNNKGINGDSDLPEEFLDAVFDEIAQNEIIMEEEHANGKLARITMGWGAGDLNDRQRMDILLFESAVDEGLQNIDFASKLSNMAKPDLSTLCLRGFSGAIRIACTFKLETERDAFVSSLAKLTSLGNFYNIKPKNVMAIRTLIDLSQDLAESMESSWVQIIKTISQIERMQMAVLHSAQPNMEVNVGSSLRDNRSTDSHKSTSDRSFYSGETTDSGYRSSSFGDHLPKKIPPALEHLVSDFQSQTSLIVIDRIFSKTINLSATAIIHFFRAVCQVSLEEVGIDAKGQPIMTATPGPPRMYLLQKIVEVAHYNVTRIRFEWTQIWRILQPHFSIVACHPNQHVATFAVDSLRQLCMKFLEREELGHFSSQHEYLRSFEWIIRHTTSPAIRELVLQSITHMITAKATSIRSGWKSIFVVLAKAGKGDERLSKIAFSTIQMIFRTYFEDVVSTGGFVDLVSCLAEFSLLKGQGPAHDELVMGSIQLLQSCAKSLVERAKEEYELPNSKPRTKRPSVYPISGAAPTLQSSSASTGVTAGTVSLSSPGAPRINNLPQQAYLMPNGCVSEGHFYLSWFPILSAFSRVVIESEGVLVRTHTLETLFDMLRSASHLFDSKYWRTIHRNIISPIFEDLSDPADEPAFGEANSAVLILGLRLLIEMISLHFDLLVRGSSDNTEHPDTGGQEFIQNSLERILFIMGKKDDKLAATGQICFQQFLLNNVHKLAKQGKWTWLVDSIEEAFKRTLPVELLNCSGPFNPDLENSHGTTTLNNNVKDGYDPQGAAIASLSTLNRDLSQNYIIDMSEIMESAHAVARETGVPLALDDLDFDHTIIKCVTHLELLQTVRDFCLTDISSSLDTVSCTDGVQRLGGKTYAIGVMTAHDRDRILKCVYASYTLARSFNSLTDLRHAIWRRGWVSQLPNLVKQETVSFSTLIVMLFGAYKTLGDSPTTLASTESQDSVGLKEHTKNPVMEALIKQSMDLLERYIVFLGDAVKHSREIVLWSPIVVLFYRELLSTGDWWSQKGIAHSEPTETNDGKSKGVQLKALKKHLPRYFRLAIRMMSVDRLEVRQVLQEFMERVGDEYICMNE
ncbi:hypothetical protein BATDEDRAFT_35363 [Batrachochytrium dendrobatidis JAM81]|uniref:SEC7 domain-containing protein n=1 Tax=Batrachochytrium dendrobatidis (strain JAM81 / FGSC 10211) TaxID=684364 RepID=F4P5D8_BATDJ|nr:uncharacterized protein BATDEDRAFT_35363 [Batrachochytrium dendrobatidis JAM81]EGF79395.1 hypothetical protein BATDEDRAFT_35363 [Batrachochytrium dendrobatidis JAM81]|eukprot:XP_006679978.1 hypothetical protein BATDEDRAFT_35363 [Batrachochytrium dendrobatidis JAM81]